MSTSTDLLELSHRLNETARLTYNSPSIVQRGITEQSLRLAQPEVLGEPTCLEDSPMAFSLQRHSLASLDAHRDTRERVGSFVFFVSQTHAGCTRNDTASNRNLLVLLMKNN